MDIKPTATLDDLMRINSKGLRVKEAAKILGVHPETVRRWADKGHINCLRHPINNYRLIYLEDLGSVSGESKIK